MTTTELESYKYTFDTGLTVEFSTMEKRTIETYFVEKKKQAIEEGTTITRTNVGLFYDEAIREHFNHNVK